MENTKKKTPHTFTEEQKKEIILKYQSGKFTMGYLARQYSFSLPGVREMLKRHGVKINNDLSYLNRKYSVNENFFEKIDNEKKAYWLGFLFADGCNFEKKNCVTIALKHTDLDHILKFRSDLECSIPTTFVDHKDKRSDKVRRCAKIAITNRKLSKDLAKLGCIAKKSLVLRYPKDGDLPKNLVRHFVRGYFDGDGTIGAYFAKRNGRVCGYKRYNTGLKSSVYFCEELLKVVFDRIGILGEIRHRKDYSTTRELRFGSITRFFKFLDWIYHDSSVFLGRKKTQYLEERCFIDNFREARGKEKIKSPTQNLPDGALD